MTDRYRITLWAWGFALLMGAASGVVAGDIPDRSDAPGLIWNRSGLPAVFPLQIKTQPGQDYVVTLIDTGTGKESLAARIIGGAFFRVLVPPGTYTLRFTPQHPAHDTAPDPAPDPAPGRAQGPTAGDSFDLADALTFETRGAGIKAGHLIDLAGSGDQTAEQAGMRDTFICQTLWLERLIPPSTTPAPAMTDPSSGFGTPLHPRVDQPQDLRYGVRSRFCD